MYSLDPNQPCCTHSSFQSCRIPSSIFAVNSLEVRGIEALVLEDRCLKKNEVSEQHDVRRRSLDAAADKHLRRIEPQKRAQAETLISETNTSRLEPKFILSTATVRAPVYFRIPRACFPLQHSLRARLYHSEDAAAQRQQPTIRYASHFLQPF